MLKIIVTCVVICIAGCANYKEKKIGETEFTTKGVNFLFSDLVPRDIWVNARGSGATVDLATQNALIRAVQQVLGVLIVSDTTISDSQIIKDIAISYSSGFIDSYSVIACGKDNIGIACEISARVSRNSIENSFKKSDSFVTVSGKNLYAQHLTVKHAMVQRKKLVNYFFSEIRKSGLRLGIKSVKTLPTTANKIPIEIIYQIDWKPEFRASFEDFLVRLQADTNAGPRGYSIDSDIEINWGGSSLINNQTFMKLKDRELTKEVRAYMVEPVNVKIMPFNKCSTSKFYVDDVFKIDYRPLLIRAIVIESESSVKSLEKITLSLGC